MKRANGEGTWFKHKEYQAYRISVDGKRKTFYGKTRAETMQKYKAYIEQTPTEEENKDLSFYEYCYKWLYEWRHKNIKQTTFD